MDSTPISAPRWRGSTATSRSVAALDIVIEALLDDVLDKQLIEDAVDEATRLLTGEGAGERADQVEAEIAKVAREQARLVAAIAAGGELAGLLDALRERESRRLQLEAEAQVHFALTDDGQLVLDGLGEDTEQAIFEFCYPALGEALATGKDVVRAVRLERARGQDGRAEPEAPATELGRRTKEELDMPTSVVNRMVSKVARRRLRSFKPSGKPS